VNKQRYVVFIILVLIGTVLGEAEQTEQQKLQEQLKKMGFPSSVTPDDVKIISQRVIQITSLREIDVTKLPGTITLQVPKGATLRDANNNVYNIGGQAGSVQVVGGNLQMKDVELKNSTIAGQAVSGRVSSFDSASNELSVKGSIVINGIKYAANQKFSVLLASDKVTIAGRDVLLTDVKSGQAIGKLNGIARFFRNGDITLIKSESASKDVFKPGNSRGIEYTTYGSFTQYVNGKPSVTYEISEDTMILQRNGCTGQTSCIHKVDGSLKVVSKNNNNIVVTTHDGSVKNLYVDPISDKSRVVYNDQKNVQLIFTKNPIKVRGNWGLLSVNVYSSYLTTKGQRHDFNIVDGQVVKCSSPCLDFCITSIMKPRLQEILFGPEGKQLLSEIQEQYGTEAKLFFLNNLINENNPRIAKAAWVASQQLWEQSHVYVPADFIYIGAVAEGLDRLIKEKGVKIGVVNGFAYLGLDTFGSDDDTLRSLGYLPADFVKGDQYTTQFNVNEKKVKVESGVFNSIEYAFTAKAAEYAWRQQLFFEDAQTMGVDAKTLSQDEVMFWTYVYYNSGQGNGKEMLTSYKKNGYLKNDNYIWKRPNKFWDQPHLYANRRMANLKLLQNSGIKMY
jgi:hypothetical protein